MDAAQSRGYGPRSWRAWDQTKPRYLGGKRQTPEEIWADTPIEVHTYREFFRVLSFLKVMNKGEHLLLRAQREHRLPVPSILRDTWTAPSDHTVLMQGERDHYWQELLTVRTQVTEVLRDPLRLPRHAPFEQCWRDIPKAGTVPPVAPWAVVQHYELWPTPLIDLTDSARVAASFALGLRGGMCHTSGYVYAFAIPQITSDLMSWRWPFKPELAPETRAPITVRLSSVCPHDAIRPHLQSGYLCGYPDFSSADLEHADSPVFRYLVGVFVLNDENTFFEPEFPRHSERALLPNRESDELLDLFLGRIRYEYTPLLPKHYRARILAP